MHLFHVQRKLTTNEAVNIIDKWKEQTENDNLRYPHVWNCMGMTGYDPMARVHWQKTIKELTSKISEIWLISDSSLIIAGAKILSLFTSFDIITVKSEADITNHNLINP